MVPACEHLKTSASLSTPDGGVHVGDGKRASAPHECSLEEDDIGRLIWLLTHEDAVDLVERQLLVLRRICKTRQEGFRFSELARVERLVSLVEAQVVEGKRGEFKTPLTKLLEICSRVPVRHHANEEFTDRGLFALSSLYRVLGKTLWSSDSSVQIATANTLLRIAAGNDPRPDSPDEDAKRAFGDFSNDMRPTSRTVNQALLLGCGVVTSTVACLNKILTSLLATLSNLDEPSLDSSSFPDSEELKNAGIGHEHRKKEDKSLGRHHDADSHDDEAHDPMVGHNSKLEIRGGEPQGTIVDGADNTLGLELMYTGLTAMLDLVRELSTDAECSAAMVEVGLMSLLVQVAQALRGVRDPALLVSVETMWNCLEYSEEAMNRGIPSQSRTALIRKARKRNASFALSTFESLSCLKEIVEALLIEGFRNRDKELRNEAVIVISQVSRNVRSHSHFRSTGMLMLLLRYATAVETGLADGNPQAVESEARTVALVSDESSGSGAERRDVPALRALADPRNFATTSDLDMEFKLLLWQLLADLCKRNAQNLKVVSISPLVETLLMYMDLVVEEGSSAKMPATTIHHSVSLASMPPMGTCRHSSETLHTKRLPPAGTEEHAASKGTHPRAGAARVSRLSSPPDRAPITGGGALRCADQASVNNRERSEQVWDTLSNASTKQHQAVDIEGMEVTDVSADLFVPATVMRLPTTSIHLLQRQAVSSLLVLAPKCPRKFQALGGHMVTLRLLDRLGARSENHRLLKVATKLLVAVLGLPGLKEELGRVDGVRIMLDRFSDACENGHHAGGGAGSERRGLDGENSVSAGGDDLRTDTVIILGRLCDQCVDNQEAFRKADGVPILMAAIQAYCRARHEAVHQQEAACKGGTATPALETLGLDHTTVEGLDPAIVHVVDCIWCAVIGNRRSEARLLQCEGLDTLLDLLELCPASMRHQVTGIIADLLRNKRSIPYARAWRSDLRMLSITQLMVRLWTAEEERLGFARPNGVLQNLWQPLQSHETCRGPRRRKADVDGHLGSLRPSTGSRTALSTDLGTMTAGSRCQRAGGTRYDIKSDASSGGKADITTDDGMIMISPGKEGRLKGPESDAGSQGETDTPLSVSVLLKDGTPTTSRGHKISGRRRGGAALVDLETSVAKAVRNLDLRAKIAAVLGLVRADVSSTDGLGQKDLKALYMATKYLEFRQGEAWQEVAAALETQRINPIAADALVLDTMLERAFDCAQNVKNKQMALSAEEERRAGEKEKAFFASIIFQRDQEIRQAVIKRNALVPGTSKKRVAAKKAKEDALKNSRDRANQRSSRSQGESMTQAVLPESLGDESGSR